MYITTYSYDSAELDLLLNQGKDAVLHMLVHDNILTQEQADKISAQYQIQTVEDRSMTDKFKSFLGIKPEDKDGRSTRILVAKY